MNEKMKIAKALQKIAQKWEKTKSPVEKKRLMKKSLVLKRKFDKLMNPL